ncbi:MAG: hypothetical protein K2Y23_06865 [Cyanobacteria bacterium]|nr:hypothetical protein [Cyanobacteriota bacterium]
MEKRTLICAAVALNLATGVACSNLRGEETVTVAGCLSAAEDGRFALTAAPDAAVATAARAMDNERDTHTYVLIGGDNLQAHLGKRVEVVGTVSGKTQDFEREATKKTEAAPAASGGDTPTVKTREDIDVEVRQLTVREVRDVAPTCVVNP